MDEKTTPEIRLAPSEAVRQALEAMMGGTHCKECGQSIPDTTSTLAEVAQGTGVKAATLRRFLKGGRVKSDDLDAIATYLD